jgi:hypothetical protein
MFRLNAVRSVMTVRMSVPCCGGLEQAVHEALRACGKDIPGSYIVLSTEGAVLER